MFKWCLNLLEFQLRVIHWMSCGEGSEAYSGLCWTKALNNGMRRGLRVIRVTGTVKVSVWLHPASRCGLGEGRISARLLGIPSSYRASDKKSFLQFAARTLLDAKKTTSSRPQSSITSAFSGDNRHVSSTGISIYIAANLVGKKYVPPRFMVGRHWLSRSILFFGGAIAISKFLGGGGGQSTRSQSARSEARTWPLAGAE